MNQRGNYGEVLETLPNLLYKVKMDDIDDPIIAHLSGKMKINKVKVLVGDTVEVVLDPYKGKATNRIIWRK